jgi:hypothetical protein
LRALLEAQIHRQAEDSGISPSLAASITRLVHEKSAICGIFETLGHIALVVIMGGEEAFMIETP